MQFDSVEQFFSMGGYGFYVWFCFGFTFFCLGALVVITKRRSNKFITEHKLAQQRLKRARKAAEADLL